MHRIEKQVEISTCNNQVEIRIKKKKKPPDLIASTEVTDTTDDTADIANTNGSYEKKKSFVIVTKKPTINNKVDVTKKPTINKKVDIIKKPSITKKVAVTKKTTITKNEVAVNQSVKPLYDVNRGFMLANSFYSADTGKIGSVDPTGWWHSEKYDGVRVIWDGLDFYTRALTRVRAPPEFKAKMPTDLALDGELFIKRNYFNETSGLVRRNCPTDHDWREIKFMVFDNPGSNLGLEPRLKMVKKRIKEICFDRLIFVKQVRVNSLQHLEELHARLVANGAEGSILRMSGSRYVPTRTDAILKVKNYSDEDAYILDWDEGHGRNTGKLGALWVRWSNPEEISRKYGLSCIPYIQFRVGSGFKDIDRCSLLDASTKYPKNTVIKVGFCGLQNSGKPRHPTFKGIRE